jgi:hypothetical protein
VDFDYQRNLRGKHLAKETLYLNGHQDDIRFIAFEPIWFGFMLLGALSVVIPPLKYVFYLGLLGTGVEAALWAWYYLRTHNIKAYPGLRPWLDIQLRRRVMEGGRLGSRLGLPY